MVVQVNQVLPRLLRPSKATSSQVLQVNAPLFQRNVPWWARWTWGLMACNIFMTGSAIELTWNHWSRPLDSGNAEHGAANAEHMDSVTQPAQYTLRPVWQRGGLCVAHLGFGVGIAVALLVSQARFVRTLAVFPASCLPKQQATVAEGPHVFLQCAHHFRKNGMVFPLDKSSLQQGRNETEMIFRTASKKGHWYIGLENSHIYGHPTSLEEARQAILEAWGGKRIGHWKPKIAVDSRWKSGPIRRQEQ